MMSKAEKKASQWLRSTIPRRLKGKLKIIGRLDVGWLEQCHCQPSHQSLWTKHLDDDEANKLRAGGGRGANRH